MGELWDNPPLVEYKLRCGKIALVNAGWMENFDFPFWGCHDLCVDGKDEGCCEFFQEHYGEWLKEEEEYPVDGSRMLID